MVAYRSEAQVTAPSSTDGTSSGQCISLEERGLRNYHSGASTRSLETRLAHFGPGGIARLNCRHFDRDVWAGPESRMLQLLPSPSLRYQRVTRHRRFALPCLGAMNQEPTDNTVMVSCRTVLGVPHERSSPMTMTCANIELCTYTVG